MRRWASPGINARVRELHGQRPARVAGAARGRASLGSHLHSRSIGREVAKQHEGSSFGYAPRVKGSTCAPDTERTSVLWRVAGCTTGSSAAWQERDGRGSAQAYTVHRWSRSAQTGVVSCAAMLPRDASLQYASIIRKRHRRACVHALTFTRTCLRSSTRRGSSSSDFRLAMQTMKPLVRGLH